MTKIKGMKIKTVKTSKMKDYSALQGKMPKNEMPKNMRHMPKNQVAIRGNVKGKRRKAILAHEKEEIKLMDKGMKYKPAHNKANKILRERKHRPVAYRKGKVYVNRLTGKHVSKTTANRINRFFEKHPGATLYEANRGAVYDPGKKWEDQKTRIYRVYKKENQIVKTKDNKGRDVYFSPILGKRVSKKNVKKLDEYDYFENGFSIHLYRMTSNRERVYHIIKYQLNRTLEEHEDIDRLEKKLLGHWINDLVKIIKNVAYKHPIGKRDLMFIAFNHLLYVTSYEQRDNGAVTVMEHRQPKQDLYVLPDEIHRAMLIYHHLLNEYTRIFVKEVVISIFNFSDEKNKAIAQVRLGIMGRGA